MENLYQSRNNFRAIHFNKKGTDDLLVIAKSKYRFVSAIIIWRQFNKGMECVMLLHFSDLFLKRRKHIFFSWLQILFQLIRVCEWREYRWNLGSRIGFNKGVDTTKRISVCLLDLPNLVVKYYIEVPLILLLLLLQRCVTQGVSKYLFHYS